jgi:stress response protein YsnF
VDIIKPDSTAEETVLPLVEEALRVGKRRIETGRVRISVATEAEERLVRETLRSERAEVERVNIGHELTEGEPAPIARREEDGTFILPVLEEVLVIERRLVLREEIRLRLVAAEEAIEETVTLRRQRAEVEKLPPAATADIPNGSGELAPPSDLSPAPAIPR